MSPKRKRMTAYLTHHDRLRRVSLQRTKVSYPSDESKNTCWNGSGLSCISKGNGFQLEYLTVSHFRLLLRISR